MALTIDKALSEVEFLARKGVAFHFLRPKSKVPIKKEWATLPRMSFEELRGRNSSSNNIGVRLGEPSALSGGLYLNLLDLDIRKPEMADDVWGEVLRMWPDAKKFPLVVSGSGGESRHIYFVTDKPFRSKKLMSSGTFEMVWDDKKQRDVKKNDWEVELFGTGKQAVFPPSIHPDTGKAYEWITPFDQNRIEFDLWPEVSADLVESWGARVDTRGGDDEDDDEWLFNEAKNTPIGADEDEVRKILDDLPESWLDDRDQWSQTGMALHHEFEGHKKGFDLWCGWSQRSEKYDERDQRRVWKSFGKHRCQSVRLPTLIQAANNNRFDQEYADLFSEEEEQEVEVLTGDIEDDFLDLLGDTGEIDLLGESGSDLDLAGSSESVSAKQGKETSKWRACLDKDGDSKVKSTLPNVELILENDIRTKGMIAHNEFTLQPTIVQKPRMKKVDGALLPTVQLTSMIWDVKGPEKPIQWSEAHTNGVRSLLETQTKQSGWGVKVSDRDLLAAVMNVSYTKTYHPIRNILERCHKEWDRERGRVETLLVRYFDVEDNHYHREVIRNFMIAAVERVYFPGSKYDFMPILQGGQGIGKSTFVKMLAMGWFGAPASEYKELQKMVESTINKWIVESPELHGLSRAEANDIKSYLSSTMDTARLSYRRDAQDFHRQFVIMGTTNDEHYLQDRENRRFQPITIQRREVIDFKMLQGELTHLWGEAYALWLDMRAEAMIGVKPEDAGEINLPLDLRHPEALNMAAELQGSARIISHEEILGAEIREALDEPVAADFDSLGGTASQFHNRVCLKQVWTEVLGREATQFNNVNSRMLGRAMNHVEGWQSGNQAEFGKLGRQRSYIRSNAAVEGADLTPIGSGIPLSNKPGKKRVASTGPRKRVLTPGKYQDDGELDLLG